MGPHLDNAIVERLVVWVRLVEVKVAWEQTILKRENDFDETCAREELSSVSFFQSGSRSFSNRQVLPGEHGPAPEHYLPGQKLLHSGPCLISPSQSREVLEPYDQLQSRTVCRWQRALEHPPPRCQFRGPPRTQHHLGRCQQRCKPALHQRLDKPH